MRFKTPAAAYVATTTSLVHEKINLRNKGLATTKLDAQDERAYSMTLPVCLGLDFYIYDHATMNDVRHMSRQDFRALNRQMRFHALHCAAEFTNSPF